MVLTVTVNGARHTINVDPARRLSRILRDDLGLTGTKVGCDAGDCGPWTAGKFAPAWYPPGRPTEPPSRPSKGWPIQTAGYPRCNALSTATEPRNAAPVSRGC